MKPLYPTAKETQHLASLLGFTGYFCKGDRLINQDALQTFI
jgi:hypothetical protein